MGCRGATLYWVDSLDRFIHRCDADGRNRQSWPLPADIGSMALRQGGGAVLALSNGFHAFDFVTGEAKLIADPENNSARTRLNDGKVDRRGRFVAGSMDRTETEPLGSVYQLGADQKVSVLDEGSSYPTRPAGRRMEAPFISPIPFAAKSTLTITISTRAPPRTAGCSPPQRRIRAPGRGHRRCRRVCLERADRRRPHHPLSTGRRRRPRRSNFRSRL